jgi:hypothetical protein
LTAIALLTLAMAMPMQDAAARDALGGAIIGGAAGALIGGAAAYCMRRFRSYDPISRTYLGYDGYRHHCP